MAGRYIITGVQLGMLLAYAKSGNSEDIEKLIDEIINNQFVGNSNKIIDVDVTKAVKLFDDSITNKYLQS